MFSHVGVLIYFIWDGTDKMLALVRQQPFSHFAAGSDQVRARAAFPFKTYFVDLGVPGATSGKSNSLR